MILESFFRLFKEAGVPTGMTGGSGKNMLLAVTILGWEKKIETEQMIENIYSSDSKVIKVNLFLSQVKDKVMSTFLQKIFCLFYSK